MSVPTYETRGRQQLTLKVKTTEVRNNNTVSLRIPHMEKDLVVRKIHLRFVPTLAESQKQNYRRFGNPQFPSSVNDSLSVMLYVAYGQCKREALHISHTVHTYCIL